MLTAAQRARCMKVAEALDRGDQGPWLQAEPTLSPEARGLVWDLRVEQQQRAAQRQQRGAATKDRLSNPQSISSFAAHPARTDLDYWADDDVPGDDDDVEPDDRPEPQTCGACHGSGRDAAGGTCKACNGTGRAPADNGDDEDLDDEQQREDEEE